LLGCVVNAVFLDIHVIEIDCDRAAAENLFSNAGYFSPIPRIALESGNGALRFSELSWYKKTPRRSREG
jgi:hypothetical protein